MAVGLWVGAVIVLLSVFLWIVGNTKEKKMINKIPGPMALPLIGNAHQFKPDGSDFFEQVLEYASTFGKKEGMFRMWLSGESYILLHSAESVEVLLSSTKHITKSRDYIFLHPWLRLGLLTSTGERWKTRRRLLTPAFHFRILNDFLQVFNEQSITMVDKLNSEVLDKGVVDIFPYITLCALDIICETAMGKTVNAQNKTDSDYVKAIYDISELINHRQRKPWYWSDFIYYKIPPGRRHEQCLKILHGFTEQVIKERSKELDEQIKLQGGIAKSKYDDDYPDVIGKRKRLAFLDLLLYESKTGAALDFLDIREEVDTFMFEGHDTTAAAANWAIHLIGAHPDVQEELHDEMDSIFGDSDRDVTMEDIKDMKYLDCVVKETLRLFPSVPMFARVLSEDTVFSGYAVPKGTTAIVLTSQLHRDERYFPDAEKFDPNRWLIENSAGRHPYCYVPFSAGMRNCIGQKFALNEEKVMLSSILRHFRIESVQKREELRPVAELILRPSNGIQVKLHKRHLSA